MKIRDTLLAGPPLYNSQWQWETALRGVATTQICLMTDTPYMLLMYWLTCCGCFHNVKFSYLLWFAWRCVSSEKKSRLHCILMVTINNGVCQSVHTHFTLPFLVTSRYCLAHFRLILHEHTITMILTITNAHRPANTIAPAPTSSMMCFLNMSIFCIVEEECYTTHTVP